MHSPGVLRKTAAPGAAPARITSARRESIAADRMGKAPETMEHDITASEPFWRNLRRRGNAAAIIDTDHECVLSFSELADRVELAEVAFRVGRKALILLFAATDAGSIAFYLAALEGGH